MELALGLRRDLGTAGRLEAHVPHSKGPGHGDDGWVVGQWEKGSKGQGFGPWAAGLNSRGRQSAGLNAERPSRLLGLIPMNAR